MFPEDHAIVLLPNNKTDGNCISNCATNLLEKLQKALGYYNPGAFGLIGDM